LPVRNLLAAMKVLLVRKALADHLINGSGLDKNGRKLDAVSQTCLDAVDKCEFDVDRSVSSQHNLLLHLKVDNAKVFRLFCYRHRRHGEW